jgi:hypothetical protein
MIRYESIFPFLALMTAQATSCSIDISVITEILRAKPTGDGLTWIRDAWTRRTSSYIVFLVSTVSQQYTECKSYLLASLMASNIEGYRPLILLQYYSSSASCTFIPISGTILPMTPLSQSSTHWAIHTIFRPTLHR